MFKRLVNNLQHFFGISRKEARAVLVLMVFSFFLIWTPFIFKRWILPLIPVTTSPVNTQRLDSIAASLEKKQESNEWDTPYKKQPYQPKTAKLVRLFPFDPNLATTDQLEELGIPKFLAARIQKYRSKGGRFRKKEDLLHIYDFPADLYDKLEPHIILKQNANDDKSAGVADRSAEKPATVNRMDKEYKPYAKPTMAPFDINTADTTQLVRLKGIGSKLSLRILKFRDAMGGFHAQNQFSEVFGLDSLAVSELNKYARIQSPVKKLNINTATLEQLSAHPYLRNKRLAQVIVNYREQHGPYTSAEDLKKVRVLDDAMIAKITPYLSFEQINN